MTAPLVHVFSASVKEGQLESLKAYAQEHIAFTQQHAPDLLAFHYYLTEDGGRVSVVQLHPDADHMDFFMKAVVFEHGLKAYEYLEHDERSDAYGPLNTATLEGLRHHGVDLHHRPLHLGGFSRIGAA